MRRRRYGHRANGRPTGSGSGLRGLPLNHRVQGRGGPRPGQPIGSAGKLRLLAPNERHLSERQLVDLAIGASSRADEIAARHHLAACSLCREVLDNMRNVDRQLELEGGGRLLAAIPQPSAKPWIDSAGLPPSPTAGRGEIARTAAGRPPRWQRLGGPLAAALTIFVIQITAMRSLAPDFTPDRETDVAHISAAPSNPTSFRGQWHVFGREAACSREELSARHSPGPIAAPPSTVEAEPPAMPSPERAADDPGTSRRGRAPRALSTGGSAVAAPNARAQPARRQKDSTSWAARQGHPGAGRGDDRISPPPRGLSV